MCRQRNWKRRNQVLVIARSNFQERIWRKRKLHVDVYSRMLTCFRTVKKFPSFSSNSQPQWYFSVISGSHSDRNWILGESVSCSIYPYGNECIRCFDTKIPFERSWMHKQSLWYIFKTIYRKSSEYTPHAFVAMIEIESLQLQPPFIAYVYFYTRSAADASSAFIAG